MRASVIFSTNDTVANLGVIVAGLLVAWSESALPDRIIGTAISLLVLRGGQRILRDANRRRGFMMEPVPSRDRP